jgi:tripartite-type tricarboxylate transporter receptor subunit TctC
MNRRRAVALLAMAAAGLAAGVSVAQDASQFPSRNIHIIVPNAAGGGLDFFARLVGAKLSDRIGRPVVVENRPGANGTPRRRTKSTRRPHAAGGPDRHADGEPIVVPNLAYDSQRDFVPISMTPSFR